MHSRVLVVALLPLLFGSVSAFAGDEPDHGDHHGEEETSEGHSDHAEEAAEAIRFDQDQIKTRNISIEKVGPHPIARTLPVNAKVSANNDRLAHLHPRFSGLLKEVRKQVGEKVGRGEVVAVVESNQSLQRYDVAALLDGTVLYRHATLGEFVDESRPIFVISDLTTVWVNLHIFPRDFDAVAVGQAVRVWAPHAPSRIFRSKISFMSGVVDQESQARVARAVIENPDEGLFPDQYVNAEVILESFAAPCAVSVTALQGVGERTIVFVLDGDRFMAREVSVGRVDREYAEILSGVTEGESYAAGNTFILKAEMGKGSAQHDH